MNEPKVILCSWVPQRPTVIFTTRKAAEAMVHLSASTLTAQDAIRAASATLAIFYARAQGT